MVLPLPSYKRVSDERVVGVETAKGDAAGGIDQSAIPGNAEAAANRTLDVGARVCRDSAATKGKGKGGVNGITQARSSTVPSRPNTHWLIW